jgi:hypothetical protein
VEVQESLDFRESGDQLEIPSSGRFKTDDIFTAVDSESLEEQWSGSTMTPR